MAQQFFSSVVWADVTGPLNVHVGFQAARIEIIDLDSVQTPANTRGWKAVWQSGMVDGSAIISKYDAALATLVSYQETSAITAYNPVGFEKAQYGAVVSAFTNANTGVITVDSTVAAQLTAGCTIRVAAVADDQTGLSLNGDYVVASVTGTTVVTATDTSAFSVYISGGFVTLLKTAAATIPNPPYNIFSNVPTWYNAAFNGFTIGTSAIAGAVNGDTILVAAYDLMSP